MTWVRYIATLFLAPLVLFLVCIYLLMGVDYD
jgi:hypothetical protein